ncbi:putative quinol monooxygenase [Litoreibacter roseus]|uniref:Antibiotic biosynthesis monooxygenase n=1 Tax=Litoreibacter roseus TaxID=2601869 RepID=A0A6N6JCY0_9RHOB|nr:putative quinol monooxygenase [Litoreibacter roseus]GFE63954.1 antibiotic biosynthesis monooxygenase [Litoreibacter roseus]
MYAVTVEFSLKSGNMNVFLPLMEHNARTSVRAEPDCLQFDVCSDPARPDHVFLYELYSNAKAFELHLATAHFRDFDAKTRDMIAEKHVRTYSEVQR